MSDPNHGYKTYGQYLRSKRITVGYSGIGGQDASAQKAWDKELDFYRDTVKQGINPAGTQTHQIREAVELSEMVGRPYDAATGKFGGDYFVPSTKEFIPGSAVVKWDE